LKKLKIPLPPLTEQKRIASLLARADRLRQLRRTAHDLGDALLQSVFLEMFGDPPLSLQEEFAGVVARVESLRGRMGESTRQVEGLFESLLADNAPISFDDGWA
jgi:type I restriction enzyme, S subunit